MSEQYDIAIVGYGPVGQTLAILLGLKGWSVAVFERQPFAYPLPRAVHFDHEVGRILQAAGVGDAVAGMTEVGDVYEWRNRAGQTLLRFDSKASSLSGWPEANMFAQPELERLLDARAQSLPSVQIHRGCEVLGIETGRASVTLNVSGTEGDAFDVEARYVIGCDGANSFVRQYLGATVTDLGFFFDWLIVDVVPDTAKVWSPLNLQICDPARPTTVVSGGPGRRRWEFMRLPHESIEDLNVESTAWQLLAPWSITPENATLERHTVYRFQAKWVDKWRNGRLLLAGDAAHQMPPFAGQGMCSGLRDAANLAWKLDLVLAGEASEGLLDTYASERVPHVSGIINFSMALGRVICVLDASEAAARDASMIPAARDGQMTTLPAPLGIGPGVRLDDDPLAGRLFVQGRVQRGTVAGLFDDVIGRGWTLLSPYGNPAEHLDPASASYFAGLGGISANLGENGTVPDLEGVYRRWFDRNGVGVVLQRPDFYVFGTAPRIEDASRLVSKLRGVLRAK